MANPYRWGDVTPARALELKRRREYRASQFFSGLKARRGEAFDLAHGGEAICPRKYPEPIGVDAIGQPIFPEAGTPEAGQPPSSQSGDAAPQ